MLFENKEMLCKKENDGSTPSTPSDWLKDIDVSDEGKENMLQDLN